MPKPEEARQTRLGVEGRRVAQLAARPRLG